jgi:glycerate kinase
VSTPRTPVLLVAPDKFRGTATAHQVAAAMARGAAPFGWTVHQVPLADGGEGLLEVLDGLGGTRLSVAVTGPLGTPVMAEWVGRGPVAVVEMARASGLVLAGGAAGNDPVAATSRGTGELILAAARAGPTPPETIVVGLGGSATTDGGWGAVEVIEEAGGLGPVELIGACDVDVRFVEAAAEFGPQTGAGPEEVAVLRARLEEVADRYASAYGVDVREVAGAGAAGGFGGAVVALGGELRSGYRVVADLLGLPSELEHSRMVITGEGAFDGTSLMGKTAGSVVRDARALGIPTLVVAGRVDPDAARAAVALGAEVVSLTERFGAAAAMADTEGCIERAVAEHLGRAGAV